MGRAAVGVVGAGSAVGHAAGEGGRDGIRIRRAALETGTTVEISDYLPLYAPVAANTTLGDVVAAELRSRGVEPERGTLVTASTDLGNVSQVVPTDWIRFPVSEGVISGHSDEMREAAVTDLAHRNALLTAEALGAAARRVATDARLRASIRP